jgi:hypothetical protein
VIGSRPGCCVVFSRFGVLIWQLEVSDNDTKTFASHLGPARNKKCWISSLWPRLGSFSSLFRSFLFDVTLFMFPKWKREEHDRTDRPWACLRVLCGRENPSPAWLAVPNKKKLHFGSFSRQQKGEKKQTKASGK